MASFAGAIDVNMGVLRDAGVAAADLLYPRTCCGCGNPVRAGMRYLCWECRTLVQFMQSPMCGCCGETVSGRVDHAFVCRHCEEVPRSYDRARSAVRHEGPPREAIHLFKYSGGTWMAGDLANLLAGCVDTHYDVESIELVIPVPLHPSRRRKRGYNQAALLASLIARWLDKSFKFAVLMRIRNTDTQTRLTAARRLNNVRGAFDVLRPKAIQGKHILLVDDVMTSGATTNECARVLKAADASVVEVVTVARG